MIKKLLLLKWWYINKPLKLHGPCNDYLCLSSIHQINCSLFLEPYCLQLSHSICPIPWPSGEFSIKPMQRNAKTAPTKKKKCYLSITGKIWHRHLSLWLWTDQIFKSFLAGEESHRIYKVLFMPSFGPSVKPLLHFVEWTTSQQYSPNGRNCSWRPFWSALFQGYHVRC